MSLTSQVFIRSVGTDAFYDEKEMYLHDLMCKLHKLKFNTKDDFKKKSANRLLKKYKEILSEELTKKNKIRPVRQLRQTSLSDKNVISLFESSLTRACEIQPNELTDCLFQVEFYFYQVMKDLISQGFDYNGKHYVYFSSSAGSIRKHRGLFIEEQLFNRIYNKLTCGLTIKRVNELGGCVVNKWLAYLALSSSATDVWEDFDIDKAIVCDDLEIPVSGEMDYINAVDYSVTRKNTGVNIPLNDGVGLMLKGSTRVLRAPFVKGLLVQFDFHKFLKEKCTPDQWIVSDIYGTEHNIIEEDIQYILTKSQFKMAKYFDNWEQYKENFKKYQCEVGYCNMEAPEVPQAKINYQMLNSLHDMTDKEIEELTSQSVEEINAIGNDFQTSMKLVGATQYNRNPSYVQQALMIYPELLRDQYSRDILKDTKRSLIKQAKAGRLRINGFYRLASPDLYAYCEFLFQGNMNPQGLLADGEVSISQFKNNEEVDCLRSPHLYFEHCLRKNNRSEEVKKWFTTKCVYTASHDLLSRVLALDWDGDILLVTNDKIVRQVVKRNQEHFVPLLFDMKKANPVQLTPDNIYQGLVAAFKYGKIGIYSNSAAKIWGKGNIDDNALTALKLLVAESNWSIDAAKCLYMPERPEQAGELIQQATQGKLPHYFKYAKDKDDKQVEPPNNSTMNRICQSIPNTRVKFVKMCDNFDYRMLMNLDYGFSISEDNQIVERYNYWNRHQYLFNTEAENAKQEDMYMFQQIRKHILEETNEDINVVVNTLVMYLYTIKTNNMKKTLWASFGDVLVENLKKNTASLGKVCEECGDRFVSLQSNHRFCSDECCKKAKAKRVKYKRRTVPPARTEKVIKNDEISQNNEDIKS